MLSEALSEKRRTLLATTTAEYERLWRSGAKYEASQYAETYLDCWAEAIPDLLAAHIDLTARLAAVERERDVALGELRQTEYLRQQAADAATYWRQRAAATEARLAEVRAALVAVEWDEYSGCPVCSRLKGWPHEPDCIVGNALAATSPAPASEGQEGASDG